MPFYVAPTELGARLRDAAINIELLRSNDSRIGLFPERLIYPWIQLSTETLLIAKMGIKCSSSSPSP